MEGRDDYDEKTGWYLPESPAGTSANVDGMGNIIGYKQADALYRSKLKGNKMLNITQLYEKYEAESRSYDKVENKKSPRQEIHALLLLEELNPGHGYSISAASHDQIWFNYDVDKVSKTATEAQILELIRCGVHLDDESFSMFV